MKVKEVKLMATEGDLTWGGKQAMQYSDDVLSHCTLETCIISITNITTINLI